MISLFQRKSSQADAAPLASTPGLPATAGPDATPAPSAPGTALAIQPFSFPAPPGAGRFSLASLLGFRFKPQWLQLGRTKKRLRTLETVSMGEKRFIALVQVDGRQFLIGGAPGNVGMLTELSPEESFHQVLKDATESMDTPALPPTGPLRNLPAPAATPAEATLTATRPEPNTTAKTPGGDGETMAATTVSLSETSRVNPPDRGRKVNPALNPEARSSVTRRRVSSAPATRPAPSATAAPVEAEAKPKRVRRPSIKRQTKPVVEELTAQPQKGSQPASSPAARTFQLSPVLTFTSSLWKPAPAPLPVSKDGQASPVLATAPSRRRKGVAA